MIEPDMINKCDLCYIFILVVMCCVIRVYVLIDVDYSVTN